MNRVIYKAMKDFRALEAQNPEELCRSNEHGVFSHDIQNARESGKDLHNAGATPSGNALPSPSEGMDISTTQDAFPMSSGACIASRTLCYMMPFSQEHSFDDTKLRPAPQNSPEPTATSAASRWSSPFLLSKPIGAVALSNPGGGDDHNASEACAQPGVRDRLPRQSPPARHLGGSNPPSPATPLVFPITRYFPHESVPGRQRILRIVPFSEAPQMLSPISRAARAMETPPFLSVDTGAEVLSQATSAALCTPRPDLEEYFEASDPDCGTIVAAATAAAVAAEGLCEGRCASRESYLSGYLESSGGDRLCVSESELLNAADEEENLPIRKRRRRGSHNSDTSRASGRRSV